MRRRLTITGSTLRPRPVAFKAAIAAALRERVWPRIEAGAIRPVDPPGVRGRRGGARARADGVEPAHRQAGADVVSAAPSGRPPQARHRQLEDERQPRRQRGAARRAEARRAVAGRRRGLRAGALPGRRGGGAARQPDRAGVRRTARATRRARTPARSAAPMLAESVAATCIVGHSERRALPRTRATSRSPRRRRRRSRRRVTPIVCVGETLAEREAGQTDAVVKRQLSRGDAPARRPRRRRSSSPTSRSGRSAPARPRRPAEAQEVHALLRAQLAGSDDARRRRCASSTAAA